MRSSFAGGVDPALPDGKSSAPSSERSALLRILLSAVVHALAACVPAVEEELAMNRSSVHDAPAMQVLKAGQGPPLVLVGGGLTGWLSWEPHAERLAPTREVARLQLLSVQYGLERRPLPDDYSVRLEGRALGAALDSLGWTEAVDLVAWSYGGLVTLDFALGNPHRVRTLTLIEPPAVWVLPEGAGDPDVQDLVVLAERLDQEITEEQLADFVRSVGLVPPGATPEELPQWEEWVRHRYSLRSTTAPVDHGDDLGRLTRFAPPVLLVRGSDTAPMFRRITEILAERFPNANRIEMPAGHAPHLVSMDIFLEELREFHSSEHP